MTIPGNDTLIRKGQAYRGGPDRATQRAARPVALAMRAAWSATRLPVTSIVSALAGTGSTAIGGFVAA
jgi:hypothetical protein